MHYSDLSRVYDKDGNHIGYRTDHVVYICPEFCKRFGPETNIVQMESIPSFLLMLQIYSSKERLPLSISKEFQPEFYKLSDECFKINMDYLGPITDFANLGEMMMVDITRRRILAILAFVLKQYSCVDPKEMEKIGRAFNEIAGIKPEEKKPEPKKPEEKPEEKKPEPKKPEPKKSDEKKPEPKKPEEKKPEPKKPEEKKLEDPKDELADKTENSWSVIASKANKAKMETTKVVKKTEINPMKSRLNSSSDESSDGRSFGKYHLHKCYDAYYNAIKGLNRNNFAVYGIFKNPFFVDASVASAEKVFKLLKDYDNALGLYSPDKKIAKLGNFNATSKWLYENNAPVPKKMVFVPEESISTPTNFIAICDTYESIAKSRFDPYNPKNVKTFAGEEYTPEDLDNIFVALRTSTYLCKGMRVSDFSDTELFEMIVKRNFQAWLLYFLLRYDMNIKEGYYNEEHKEYYSAMKHLYQCNKAKQNLEELGAYSIMEAPKFI